MASIRHLATGEATILLPSHLVGRSRACTLRLTNRLVSSEHAVFRWTGKTWELRDLGSSNGTYVDGDRVDAGANITVGVGTQVAFGEQTDIYEMVDNTGPVAMAETDQGDTRQAEDGLLILPDADEPELTIFEDGPGQWFVELSTGEQRAIGDQEQLRAGGKLWRLTLPIAPEQTWAGVMSLAGVSMRCTVSKDEEHVDLTLDYRGTITSLPPRVHSYLVLTLARARVRDQADEDLAESEHGWMYVEELIEMLNTNENHLNVAICRARRQFGRANVIDAVNLIERRPGTRQIRLGIKNLKVVTL